MWNSLDELAADLRLSASPEAPADIVDELARRLRDGGMEGPMGSLLVEAFRFAKAATKKTALVGEVDIPRSATVAVETTRSIELATQRAQERSRHRKDRATQQVRQRVRRRTLPIALVTAAMAMVWALPSSSSPLLQAFSPYRDASPIRGRFEVWLGMLVVLAELFAMVKLAGFSDDEAIRHLHSRQLHAKAVEAAAADSETPITQSAVARHMVALTYAEMGYVRLRDRLVIAVLFGGSVCLTVLAGASLASVAVPGWGMALLACAVINGLLPTALILRECALAYVNGQSSWIASLKSKFRRNHNDRKRRHVVPRAGRVILESLATDLEELADGAVLSAIDHAVALCILEADGHHQFEIVYRHLPEVAPTEPAR